ncbi:MAG: C40 family peptidase, partial [Chitinophagaceae bacterium]|nr:C40 family peptidase [Chitinophagaceae bacterium]
MRNTLLPYHLFFSVIFSVALVSCTEAKQNTHKAVSIDSATNVLITADTLSHNQIVVETTSQAVHPDSLVAFAKTLIGIPYLYASTDPIKGFDCSGFITYVFNHFNIAVPRSSVDF